MLGAWSTFALSGAPTGGAAPSIQIDYIAVYDLNPNASSVSPSFSVPAPISGQKFWFLIPSEEAFTATPSIGGSTTGVTVLDSDSYGDDRIYLVEKTGYESASNLTVALTFGASSTHLVIHGWRVVGLDYVTSSFVSNYVAPSNSTAAAVSVTKAAGDVTFVGTRKYDNVSGGTLTQDIDTGSVWAGRLMDSGSFSGTLTGTTVTNNPVKYIGAFNGTPS